MLEVQELKNKKFANPAIMDHKLILKFRITKHTWQKFLIIVPRLWRPHFRVETPFKAGAHVSRFCLSD